MLRSCTVRGYEEHVSLERNDGEELVADTEANAKIVTSREPAEVKGLSLKGSPLRRILQRQTSGYVRS